MPRILALALAFSLAAQIASARMFPVAPHGLRALLEKADLVIVAKVVGLAAVDMQPGELIPRRLEARLQVEQVLAGDLPPGTLIRVQYNTMGMCSRPPSYPNRSTVIAFLGHGDGDPPDLYQTVGMSYGSKPVGPEERRVFTDRLEELTRLESAPPSEQRNLLFIEWITKMLEHPITREAGLLDVTSSSSHEAFALSVDRMSSAQVSRLLDVLEAERNTNSSWLRFVDKLRDLPDRRLDELLLARLWTFSAAQRTGEFRGVMLHLARRADDEELEAVAKAVGDLPNGDLESEQLIERHQLVTRFLSGYAERHPFLRGDG